MPAKYEALKKKFLSEGKSLREAKTRAAKIYQATRKKGEPELNRAVAKEKSGK